MVTCQRAIASDAVTTFYVDVLTRLEQAAVPFLVGGAFACARYSNIDRETKDLDIFLRSSEMPAALSLLEDAGYRTELPFPHWLGKVWCDEAFIDLIYSSGNGLARVDDLWFEHAVEEEVLGVRVLLCPPEEIIWSKAFIQERERFDGADLMHLFRERGPSLDWLRILSRFGDNWPVLFSHLVLFRFVYPASRDQVPDWVVEELSDRFATLRSEAGSRVCNGSLLSREQYLHDLQRQGYEDARIVPHGAMTPAEAEIWTAAIADKK